MRTFPRIFRKPTTSLLALATCVWLASGLLITPKAAYADLKCGDGGHRDAPTEYDDLGFAIPWSGYLPGNSRVTFSDGSIFDTVNKQLGDDIPKDFPEQYTDNLQHVNLFNPSMFWDTASLTKWEKLYNIKYPFTSPCLDRAAR